MNNNNPNRQPGPYQQPGSGINQMASQQYAMSNNNNISSQYQQYQQQQQQLQQQQLQQQQQQLQQNPPQQIQYAFNANPNAPMMPAQFAAFPAVQMQLPPTARHSGAEPSTSTASNSPAAAMPACQTEHCRKQPLAVPASSHCVECRENLCRECEMAHQRVSSTRRHCLQRMLPINKQNVQAENHARSMGNRTCPKHDYALRFMCTCGQMLCERCLVTENHTGGGHTVQNLVNIAPKFKTESLVFEHRLQSTLAKLNPMVARVCTYRTSVEKQQQIERTAVFNQVEEITTTLRMCAVKLVDAIDRRVQVAQAPSERLLLKLNNAIGNVNHARHSLSPVHDRSSSDQTVVAAMFATAPLLTEIFSTVDVSALKVEVRKLTATPAKEKVYTTVKSDCFERVMFLIQSLLTEMPVTTATTEHQQQQPSTSQQQPLHAAPTTTNRYPPPMAAIEAAPFRIAASPEIRRPAPTEATVEPTETTAPLLTTPPPTSMPARRKRRLESIVGQLQTVATEATPSPTTTTTTYVREENCIPCKRPTPPPIVQSPAMSESVNPPVDDGADTTTTTTSNVDSETDSTTFRIVEVHGDAETPVTACFASAEAETQHAVGNGMSGAEGDASAASITNERTDAPTEKQRPSSSTAALIEMESESASHTTDGLSIDARPEVEPDVAQEADAVDERVVKPTDATDGSSETSSATTPSPLVIVDDFDAPTDGAPSAATEHRERVTKSSNPADDDLTEIAIRTVGFPTIDRDTAFASVEVLRCTSKEDPALTRELVIAFARFMTTWGGGWPTVSRLAADVAVGALAEAPRQIVEKATEEAIIAQLKVAHNGDEVPAESEVGIDVDPTDQLALCTVEGEEIVEMEIETAEIIIQQPSIKPAQPLIAPDDIEAPATTPPGPEEDDVQADADAAGTLTISSRRSATEFQSTAEPCELDETEIDIDKSGGDDRSEIFDRISETSSADSSEETPDTDQSVSSIKIHIKPSENEPRGYQIVGRAHTSDAFNQALQHASTSNSISTVLCSVCRQPTIERRLQNCVTCKRVYHSSCHIPALRKFELPRKSGPESRVFRTNWSCTLCQEIAPLKKHLLPKDNTKKMNEQERSCSERVLLSLYTHHDMHNFRQFVDGDIGRNIYVVQLAQCHRRLRRGNKDEGYKSAKRFVAALCRMFSEGVKANTTNRRVAEPARRLQAQFIASVTAQMPHLAGKEFMQKLCDEIR